MSLDKKFLSKEELDIIKELKTRKSFTALLADKYILENQKADLEYNNLILKLYMKHGLSSNDSIDEKSGEIFLFAEKEEAVESKSDNGDKTILHKIDTKKLEVPNIAKPSLSSKKKKPELDWHA